MELITKAHGKIDISDDRLITIPDGLFGFEQYTKYALVDSDYDPFLWLQSCEDPNLAFLIIDPFLVCSDYETDIDDESLIPEEKIMVVLTKKGYIKRSKPDIFRTQNRGCADMEQLLIIKKETIKWIRNNR